MGNIFFKNKNILLISPEDWTHLFVSKHHYAIELAKNGNTIFFLNPPKHEISCNETAYKNIYEINYRGFIKGLRFFPSFLQRYFLKKKFDSLQQLVAVTFDCVWSFDNSVFFDFSFLPDHVLTISHIVDFSQNFQFRRAAATSDICFGVSGNIVERLALINRNSYLVPHGISTDMGKAGKVKLPGNNPIKAVYAGNLKSVYIDQEIVYALIDNNPQVDFIFLGPGAEAWRKESNTFFLGFIEREQLMRYLESADVLLLLYATEKFPEQVTNAHKILEYLSAGKVIVSSLISDYRNKGHLLKMAQSRQEIVPLFSEVISNLEWYNNEENFAARKLFAAENTYAHRLKEIEQLLRSLPHV